MKYYYSLSLCLIITIHVLLFFPCCLADIWNTKISLDEVTTSGDPVSMLFLDVFGFTATGRVELNMSDISISNPKNLNLSLVGFFLAPRSSIIDGRMKNFNTACYLQSDFVKRLYTFDRGGNNNKTLDFEISVSDPNVFNLFFQNCLLIHQNFQVSMNIQTSMYNIDPRNGGFHNYLSAGKNYLFGIYFIFTCIYLFLTGFCIHALNVKLRASNDNHHVILPYVVLIFTISKLWSFGVQSVNLYYMAHNGHAQTLVAVLFTFISSVIFNPGHPLIVFLYLLCYGGQFLPDDKRKIFINVLFLIIFQILTYLWGGFIHINYIDHSLYLNICGVPSFIIRSVVFFTNFVFVHCQIVLTTKHLLQDEQVEGKAALILKKVKMLRKLYYGGDLYNYFSFFVVTGFEMFALYTKYQWTGVLVEESTILAMFLFAVWIFWPMAQNNFFSVSIEEEISAVEALKDWKTCGLKHIFWGSLFSERSK